MNASLLLVTTAWLAGADAPPAPPAHHPAPPAHHHHPAPPAHHHHPAPPAHGSCSCGPSCNVYSGCCEEEREGFFARLRRHFGGNGDDCCADSHVTICQPACPTTCCEEDRPGLFDRLRAHFGGDDDDCCASMTTWQGGCGSCASACECEEERGLFNRLRKHFRRDDDCGDPCHTPCTTCGSVHPPHGHVYPRVMPPAGKPGEKIPAPKDPGKKLPEGSKTSLPKAERLPSAPKPMVPASPRPLDLGGAPY